jgi:hypothetical protein
MPRERPRQRHYVFEQIYGVRRGLRRASFPALNDHNLFDSSDFKDREAVLTCSRALPNATLGRAFISDATLTELRARDCVTLEACFLPAAVG